MNAHILFASIFFTVAGAAMLLDLKDQYDHPLNLVVPILFLAIGIWGFVRLFQPQAA